MERLYLDHGQVVLRRARRLLQNEEEARDVLHDLFCALAGDRNPFGGRSAVTTWLYGATTNLCLTRLRKRRTRKRLLGRERPAGQSGPATDARALAQELLSALPCELAEVAVYYYVDEMTQQEIAEVLGCSRRRVGDLVQKLRMRADQHGRAA